MFFTIRSEDGFWFSDFRILLRIKATSGKVDQLAQPPRQQLALCYKSLLGLLD
jgi:hypothetical protein